MFEDIWGLYNCMAGLGRATPHKASELCVIPEDLGKSEGHTSEQRDVVWSLESEPAPHLHSVNQVVPLRQEVGS